MMDIKKIGFAGNGQFTLIAEKLRLNYTVRRNARLQDITALQKAGYRVIVNYTDPIENIGHFAVVKRIDNTNIHLLDPWQGPNHKMRISSFKKCRKSMFEPDKHSFIAIK